MSKKLIKKVDNEELNLDKSVVDDLNKMFKSSPRLMTKLIKKVSKKNDLKAKTNKKKNKEA